MKHNFEKNINPDCTQITWKDTSIYTGVDFPPFSDLQITYRVKRKSTPEDEEVSFTQENDTTLEIDYLIDGLYIVEKDISLIENPTWTGEFETTCIKHHFIADCKSKICQVDVTTKYAELEKVGCQSCDEKPELCKLKKIADNIDTYLKSVKLAMETSEHEKAYRLIELAKAECISQKDITVSNRECNGCN